MVVVFILKSFGGQKYLNCPIGRPNGKWADKSCM
jgi:hypothetical protein